MTDDSPDYEVGYRKPPAANRFSKGRSGNPTGRPKGADRQTNTSAFELILDKTLTVDRNGRQVEITLDEALQHKLLQDALAGNRPARREVMKMLLRRERALAASAPLPPPATLRVEPHDPDNADEALTLLGVAAADPYYGHPALKLQAWAVQAALNRRRRPRLSRQDLSDVKSRTLNPEEVKWPSDEG